MGDHELISLLSFGEYLNDLLSGIENERGWSGGYGKAAGRTQS
jgi:hypothetical protein